MYLQKEHSSGFKTFKKVPIRKILSPITIQQSLSFLIIRIATKKL